jgi:hypothetical protein
LTPFHKINKALTFSWRIKAAMIPPELTTLLHALGDTVGRDDRALDEFLECIQQVRNFNTHDRALSS